MAYDCNGTECSMVVGENGLWFLEDGSVIVLCKIHEEEARQDGTKLSK